MASKNSKSLLILVIVLLVGLGIFLTLKTVRNTYLEESRIDLTLPASDDSIEGSQLALTLDIDETSEVSVEGVAITVEELRKRLSLNNSQQINQHVIIRLDDRATHKTLIQIKDLVDEAGYESLIEITRQAEGAQ